MDWKTSEDITERTLFMFVVLIKSVIALYSGSRGSETKVCASQVSRHNMLDWHRAAWKHGNCIFEEFYPNFFWVINCKVRTTSWTSGIFLTWPHLNNQISYTVGKIKLWKLVHLDIDFKIKQDDNQWKKIY